MRSPPPAVPEFIKFVDDHGNAGFIVVSEIESVRKHNKGTIIRTKSGDFHVAQGAPHEFMRILFPNHSESDLY